MFALREEGVDGVDGVGCAEDADDADGADTVILHSGCAGDGAGDVAGDVAVDFAAVVRRWCSEVSADIQPRPGVCEVLSDENTGSTVVRQARFQVGRRFCARHAGASELILLNGADRAHGWRRRDDGD